MEVKVQFVELWEWASELELHQKQVEVQRRQRIYSILETKDETMLRIKVWAVEGDIKKNEPANSQAPANSPPLWN